MFVCSCWWAFFYQFMRSPALGEAVASDNSIYLDLEHFCSDSPWLVRKSPSTFLATFRFLFWCSSSLVFFFASCKRRLSKCRRDLSKAWLNWAAKSFFVSCIRRWSSPSIVANKVSHWLFRLPAKGENLLLLLLHLGGVGTPSKWNFDAFFLNIFHFHIVAVFSVKGVKGEPLHSVRDFLHMIADKHSTEWLAQIFHLIIFHHLGELVHLWLRAMNRCAVFGLRLASVSRDCGLLSGVFRDSHGVE